MGKQSKSGSAAKRRKEYTGGGAWGGRFSRRELERELAERADVQAAPALGEPDREGSVVPWLAVGLALWAVVVGALYALR